MTVANKYFENASKFKYLMKITINNEVHKIRVKQQKGY
jgi:hypothetical protein